MKALTQYNDAFKKLMVMLQPESDADLALLSFAEQAKCEALVEFSSKAQWPTGAINTCQIISLINRMKACSGLKEAAIQVDNGISILNAYRMMPPDGNVDDKVDSNRHLRELQHLFRECAVVVCRDYSNSIGHDVAHGLLRAALAAESARRVIHHVRPELVALIDDLSND